MSTLHIANTCCETYNLLKWQTYNLTLLNGNLTNHYVNYWLHYASDTDGCVTIVYNSTCNTGQGLLYQLCIVTTAIYSAIWFCYHSFDPQLYVVNLKRFPTDSQ